MTRSFSGATDDDLNHHTIQLLQKKLSHIILHTETNDTYPLISREILSKLLNFKELVQQNLYLIVTPRLRSNYEKIKLTRSHLTNHLLQLNTDIVDNRNITSKH